MKSSGGLTGAPSTLTVRSVIGFSGVNGGLGAGSSGRPALG